MNAQISYRPDIDGLRALAVLSVVFFHMGATFLSGGFIGVDIFFVISGYLITSIILREQQSGTFSLGRFYERRISRIFPALFAVMAVTTIVGYFLLFPPDFEYFGESVAATAIYISNFLFWKESGYFETDSLSVPLLHTWSLAVEEQFYIFFPLILIGLQKFAPRFKFHAVIFLLAASFAACLLAIYYQKYDAMFYLLPMRAWELMIGSVLAFGIIPVVQKKRTMDILAIIGFGLIAYALFFFDHDTVFPGPAALLPTIGAMLIIYSGFSGQSLSYKVLRARLPVFFGKISYSLYLWHWPVIVYIHYAAPFEVKGAYIVPTFAVCGALSWLSWKFIEQPLRNQKKFNRKAIFITAAIVTLCFAAVGMAIKKNDGLADRFPMEIQKLYQTSIGRSLPVMNDVSWGGYRNIIGSEKVMASFMLWGDSHATAASPALDDLAKARGIKGYFVGTAGCIPAVSSVSFMEKDCNDYNANVLSYLQEHKSIKKVILLSYWSAYERRFAKQSGDGASADFESSMKELFERLTKDGYDIVVVLEVPAAPVEDIILYMMRAEFYGKRLETKGTLTAHNLRQRYVRDVMSRLSEEYGFKIVDPTNSMCPKGICVMAHNGQSLYYDNDHLSTYGSLHFKEAYAPVFK